MFLTDLLNHFSNLKIIRNGEFDVTRYVDSTHEAKILTFIGNKKYIELISPNISCIIASADTADYIPKQLGLIISENPKELFFLIHNYLAKKIFTIKSYKTKIGINCAISKTAVIAENNVTIGDYVTIGSGVVIGENTSIGNYCTIHEGAIIGGVGFHYTTVRGTPVLVQSCGGVTLGDWVEISNNTCIVKSVWANDDTALSDYTKVDNLVHIAHGTKIGRNCIIAAGTIFGGNAVIGENVFFGLNCTVKNSIKIADNCTIGMGAVVIKDVLESCVLAGNPARKL